MTRATARRIAAVCIAGAVLFACGYYIARNFRWHEILLLLSWGNAVAFFVDGTTAIILFWVIRAFRWYFLLRGMQTKVNFLDLYFSSAVALSLTIVTPFQSGELLKVELLRKYGRVDRAVGYSSFLIERVTDLYVVLAMGCVALAIRWGEMSRESISFLLLAFGILPIAAYALLHKLKIRGRPGTILQQVQAGVGSIRALLILVILAFVGWAVVALGWQSALYSISIDASFIDVLGLLAVITLMSVLSFVPGGLGVAEVGTSEFLMRLGVSASHAQAGALVIRCFGLLALGLGFAHLVVWKLRPGPMNQTP